MKTKAENAIRSLCARAVSGDGKTWRKIDRLERRFGCVGMADAIMERNMHAAFMHAETRRARA